MANKNSSSLSPSSLFGGSTDWLKPVTQAPMKIYAAMWNETLRFGARSLRDQADYVQKLSECTDPAMALRCHGEFMQQSWARSMDEGSKLLSSLQTSLSSSSE